MLFDIFHLFGIGFYLNKGHSDKKLKLTKYKDGFTLNTFLFLFGVTNYKI